MTEDLNVKYEGKFVQASLCDESLLSIVECQPVCEKQVCSGQFTQFKLSSVSLLVGSISQVVTPVMCESVWCVCLIKLIIISPVSFAGPCACLLSYTAVR